MTGVEREPLRWAIVGTGTIANRMAADLTGAMDARHVATLSRNLARAEAFNQTHGLAGAFDDVDELIDETRPDIAYIATPHAQHPESARAFIRRGVGVLVEKPFTCTAEATVDLFEQARRADVYACEAMWMLFNPVVRALLDAVSSGEIGDVLRVETAQGFDFPFDPTSRVWDPERGGGATLDLGCYAVALLVALLGPTRVDTVEAALAPNGLDASADVVLRSEGGAIAQAVWSFERDLRGEARVVGQKGQAVLAAPFQRATRLTVNGAGGERTVSEPLRGLGFVSMIEAVSRDLRAERTRSAVVTEGASISAAHVLDQALAIIHAKETDR
ncbi:Gfo/Idh/MocA family protein [Microbacterium sp. NPDC055910]|uniref:Gfo/Idh/MocA family protein n=1 Tax=Microbacterium sp. NPDC055910 TaxID=3345659 RepID=UPI0035DE7483